MSGAVNVAVVGMGFGEFFLPVYDAHPDVGQITIVEPDDTRREQMGNRYGIADRRRGLDDVLGDDAIHAIHILTPVRFHASHTIAALDAGKHVACAVPMATSLKDIDAIIAAHRRSTGSYMMMETARWTRELLTTQALVDDGAFGDLALYRGFHIQNLYGFASYWQGFPPMHYATHALSPILALTGDYVRRVRCLGSGHLTEEQAAGGFDNRFPTEIGLFELERSDMLAEVTMSFFRLARDYREGFDLFGEQMSVEWPAVEDGPMISHRLGDPEATPRGRQMRIADLPTNTFSERLPSCMRGQTEPFLVKPADGSSEFTMPAEHGGSHPHLVHEFLSSIIEDRPSVVDAAVAAGWTAPGIVAHASAMAGGDVREVPDYRA